MHMTPAFVQWQLRGDLPAHQHQILQPRKNRLLPGQGAPLIITPKPAVGTRCWFLLCHVHELQADHRV